MHRIHILIAAAVLALAPSAFAQITLPPLPPVSSVKLPPLPVPTGLPELPALPVIPVGPRIKGNIPVMYNQSGVVIYYDTQSPFPVEYRLVGIVGPP